ncbi:MAG: hypothetical protein IRZ32_15640 [Solirubrobacteraceae bacterium]|nr:hypothetical protein [Solirubrobacteraceae bacterium]
MPARIPLRPPLAAVLAAALLLALGAAAPGRADAPAAVEVTAAGAGAVKVGATWRSLRAKRLVGPMRPGCPLAGPGTRSARLRAPLQGSVDLTRRSPRRVRTIAITGGATARGVGVGSTSAQLRAAFPRARFDHATDETFEATLVRVPRSDGGPLQFMVGVRADRVIMIGVPRIPFCE